jgi:hypothetical protein
MDISSKNMYKWPRSTMKDTQHHEVLSSNLVLPKKMSGGKYPASPVTRET